MRSKVLKATCISSKRAGSYPSYYPTLTRVDTRLLYFQNYGWKHKKITLENSNEKEKLNISRRLIGNAETQILTWIDDLPKALLHKREYFDLKSLHHMK